MITGQFEYEAILVTSAEKVSPLPPLLVFPHGTSFSINDVIIDDVIIINVARWSSFII